MNKLISVVFLILMGTASIEASAYDTDSDGVCDGPVAVENPACQSTVCEADLDTIWYLTCDYYDGDSASCTSLGFCSYSGGQCDYSPVSCETYNGDEPGCLSNQQCSWTGPDQCTNNPVVACNSTPEGACGVASSSCVWSAGMCEYRGVSTLTSECVAADADACALLDFCAINPDCLPLCEAGPDNCPSLSNPDQADTDGDGIGDACDVEEIADPTVPNGLNFEVSNSTWGGVGGKPAVSHDGTNFMVAWLDASLMVRVTRVTPHGSVLDSGGVAMGAGDEDPSVSFNGVDYLVIWVENSEIWGAKVGTDGTVDSGSPFVITTGANAKSRDISLAFDGVNYLITWRTNSDRINAARVATNGTIIGATTGFELGGGFYPWVAFDGTNYMVVWHAWGSGGNHDVFANRVATDGTVLDGSGFTVFAAPGDQEHTSVAYGNGIYLVTWNDSRGDGGGTSGNNRDARGVRVNTAGVVLDTTAIVIGDRSRHQVPVNAIFDGTDFLVVWQVDLQPVDHRATDVYGRRVSISGAVIDVQGIPMSTAFHNQFGPRVGFGGGRHLVVWEEDGHCDNCMWGQMLEKGTIVTGPPPPPTAKEVPRVALDAPFVWTTEPQPAASALLTALGVDGNDVYAGGPPQNALFHWDGSSWTSITYPEPTGVYDIWSAAAPDDLWIAGWCYHVSRYDGEQIINPSCLNWPEPGLGLGIWRLTDTGVTLVVGALSDSKYYNGPIDYYDGEPPTYWWPSGDWAQWDPVDQAVDVNLHGIWATPAQQAYAVGEFGTVLQWDGAEWLSVPGVPTVQTLNSIWGPDDGGFFVVGDFGTILHYDGASWTTHVSGTTEHLFGVSGVNGSEVYAVGLGGTILRYDGASWTAEDSGTDKILTSVTRAGDRMLAVGDGGVVRSRPITPYAASSDLAISKTADVATAIAGTTVSYDVVVSNLTSGAGLVAVTVADTPPVTLDCNWTCVSTVGATCRRGPWSGNLDDTIELPETATATYTAECVIDQGASPGIISNTATVAVVTGIVDPVPANNTASDDIEIVPAYSVGGNVSGLSGSGLILQNNGGDDLAVGGGGFTFVTPVINGGSYSVSVLTQPTSPNQTCSVSNASGIIADANVTSVAVNCVTETYTIGGNVSGLSGSGLTLQNNAGDDLMIGADGGFTFSAPLIDGSGYAVTVLSQPTNLSQVCSVTNDSGTLAGANVTDVTVSCVTSSFTVGGVASDVEGDGLVLQNNDSDNLAISADGGFTFVTPLLDGSPYTVTLFSEPVDPNQICTIENGAGTVAGANVVGITVTCVPDAFTIGGTVSGLSGSGLMLQNNGGDDLAVSENGGFAFATPLENGTYYTVSVLTQPTNPNQTCTESNHYDWVNREDVTDVSITCVTDTFAIGGSVSGLEGSGLVLQNNAGDSLAIGNNGVFTFATELMDGSAYSVSVLDQPTNPNQFCHLENSSGTLAGDNVADVVVTCVPACNIKTVSDVSVDSEASFEACEILVLGPDFTAEDGADVSVNSGWEIDFLPGFLVEEGATLNANVCGQSLCLTSPFPMPYGCHSCVDLICDTDWDCCNVQFDQSCVNKVNTLCSLACE